MRETVDEAGALVLSSRDPVLIVGAGPVDQQHLTSVLSRTGHAVAADGGASALLRAGRVPDAVIGDLDSIDPEVAGAIPSDRLHRVAEQDSTDFQKCLSRIQAPLILAMGFSGGRDDHSLAVLHALVRAPDRRCILIGGEDLCFLAPPRIALDLVAGTRVSLFPMGAVQGTSTGLHWPIDGIAFAPWATIGTSNRATGAVSLTVDRPLMLVFLPLSLLDQAIPSLLAAPGWSAPV